ncbi:MAG: PIN domain-containing protein [Pirellulales bacterium]|nr:PIN domain-containing protein [Pirellulales bacterium]
MPNLALLVLRAVFVMVAIGLGAGLSGSDILLREPWWLPWATIGGIMLLAAGVIFLDNSIARKELQTVTAVYFGLIVGMFLTYVVRLAMTPLLAGVKADVVQWVELIVGMILCYFCISILLQTKDDFRFIIPYVEFARDVKGRKPFILDTSVIIDGRIADVVETRAFDNQLIIPSFVVAEIQGVADSADRMRRSRGRRGLDILNRLRNNKELDLQIHDRELKEYLDQPVDMKLVILAKHLNGKVVTNDYNLNKVANLNGVGVINLNDLANALKPVFLVGEAIEVRIVKPGEGHGQGIGYLDDGTMIVVEGGREHVNQSVRVTVTSMLQKSAGRMVFAKYDSQVPVLQG